MVLDGMRMRTKIGRRKRKSSSACHASVLSFDEKEECRPAVRHRCRHQKGNLSDENPPMKE